MFQDKGALTCIHCLTRDSSLKGRFNSFTAKSLGGSGRKDWPEALLSFWCVVKLKQMWVFLSSEQTSQSSCLCRIYPLYSGSFQTRAFCNRYVQVISPLSETFLVQNCLRPKRAKSRNSCVL